MKRISLFLMCISLLVLIPGKSFSQVGFGNASKFNAGWKFLLGDSSYDADDTDWRSLVLPHDWSVESTPSQELASCTGFLPGGIGWYKKHFTINDNYKKHYIYFEGVYNRSEVYLNGHLLGKRPNGYVSFMYDMTPYLKNGENVIAVKVDHSKYADSRWYTGSGIYRDVWLVGSDDVHFSQWGVAVTTDIKSTDGFLDVTADVDGQAEMKNLVMKTEIFDANGTKVQESTSKGFSQTERGYLLHTRCSVRNPHLWSTKSPYLYNVKTSLLLNGKVIDKNETATGFRTLSFNADKGFALNGQPMKVKGVCLHHDAGVLGSVVPKDVWRRRLMTLKDMGVNAIRMSHNPQAPDLYDLCDEMGFLVMDEGSDEWEFPKRKWIKGWNQGEPGYDGTFDFFEEWIDKDVTDMVRRDRNHPSVFLWSVGNEVDYPNDPYSHPVLDGNNSKINQPMFGGYKPDAPKAERIGKIAKRLAACIRNVDRTRPVTGALAGVVMSNETEYPEAVDVVGYNYTENRYKEDHATYPKRILYGSETSTNLAAWKAVRDNEYIFGQFVWTGMDYLGESGTWPSRGLGTGLVDFAGFLKPRGWFFKSLWSEEPMIYIGTAMNWSAPQGQNGNQRRGRRNMLSTDAADNWNYQDGQSVRVMCYMNTPKARLLLNGREVGELKPYDDSTGIIYWDIPYEKGTLSAEGCDANGKVVARYEISTYGEQTGLRVTDISPDKGSSVRQLLVEAVDANGQRVKNARGMVECKVSGKTKLLGLENANNRDMSAPKATSRNLYQGRMVAYIEGSKDEVEFVVSNK